MREKIKLLVTEARAGNLTLQEVMTEVKRGYILAALVDSRLNQCRAAKRLGIHRNTLGRNLDVLNISVAELKKPAASVSAVPQAFIKQA